MKKSNITFLTLSAVFTITLLIVWPFENGSSQAMSNKGSEGSQSFQDARSGQVNTIPIIFDDFELNKGLEIITWKQKRFIQLGKGSREGHAENYFFEQSAKYDVTLFYVNDLAGKSEVRVIINDRSIGSIMFDLSNSVKQKTIHGINIQQWSKIAMEFTGDGDGKCRIEKLVFTPIGAFDGKVANLVKPVSLKIFETTNEQLMGHRVFTDFVQSHNDSLTEKRKSELSGLKSPLAWKERQKKTRAQLSNIFGEFPEKTPLNARIVGKLDREHCTIEKVIFESQPKYYVTANLYIPKDRKFPLPGVVFTCGHYSDAKAYDEYEMTCLGLVLKGYVVLIFDPMGEGERSEYFDMETKKPLIDLGISMTSQHLYLMRPSFLTGRTLSGLRTWDAIRAVDYLLSRPEVDKNKLASVGQSGGGQMALLLTAVDERIKVCASSGPGGDCESTYLLGQDLIDREIFSLIPPRPLRIIYGKESGEEAGHREKLEDIQLFYKGLGVGTLYRDLVGVPGEHTMNRYHREAVYEWLNKWFDKETEGKAEGILKPEKIEDLWCTESGNTMISLRGETGQTLNAKRAGQIYKPEKNLAKLKERIAVRVGLTIPQNDHTPKVHSFETISHEDLSIEKLTYESEMGIVIPALLLKPKNVKINSPIYIYASDKGKPNRIENSILPFLLAKNGAIVLAIDVRGIGETSPTVPLGLNKFVGNPPLLWKHDSPAIQSAGFGRTTLGMRTLDVMQGIDFLNSRDDLKGRKIVVVGEGLGGLWALLASVYDSRINGVVTIGTLPSYMMLITNQYYNVWGYFWVPGALRDFDIPDLARLVSPKPQIWIDPLNAMGEKLNLLSASSTIGSNKNLQIITPDNDSMMEVLQLFNKSFN